MFFFLDADMNRYLQFLQHDLAEMLENAPLAVRL